MKLPRWTVYPALAVIGTLLFTALPHTAETPEGSDDPEGAALRARAKIVEKATAGDLDELRSKASERATEIDAVSSPDSGN